MVGDTVGVPRLLRHMDPSLLCAIVAAEIRPQQHAAIANVAAQHAVPFLIQPRNTAPGYSAFVQSVAERAPELILCDSYSMLLRPDVLRLSRAGAVNVHGGMLPRYRGANPIQWMLISDESDAGVTIHYMDDGFDSGDVIARRSVEVTFTDTWRDVMARINVATDELLAAHLPAILAGTAPATPQDPAQARRFDHRKPADGRIDWSKSVRDIYNLVRALVSPLPGAFYVTEAETVVLDNFMPIAEVALLKQRMMGGAWRVPDGGRLRILPGASDERIALDVRGTGGEQTGEAELTALDYVARSAIVRLSSSVSPTSVLPEVEEFARSELGITRLISR